LRPATSEETMPHLITAPDRQIDTSGDVQSELSLKTRQDRWMGDEFESGLVSVIVPTYNRNAVITETLDSVWSQTYRPIEVIVVDDGSTDNTQEVVDAWSQAKIDNDGFKLSYLHQANTGPSAARNRGLIESHGKYIQFMDSDDLLHPERFERVVKVMEELSCDFIQTGFDGFCARCGETIEWHYGKPGQDQLAVACKGRLWPNSLRSFFHRKLALQTGPWNEEMIAVEDTEYIYRALSVSRQSDAIRDILASARRGGNCRITDRIRTRKGRECRIWGEKSLCDGVRERSDVPIEAKQDLASRLYGLAYRSNLSGWPDLGQRCVELAESLDVKLDSIGKRRRLVWRSGKWAGKSYEFFGGLKERILQRRKYWREKHKCNHSDK